MSSGRVTLFAKHEPTITGTSRYARALRRELVALGWDAELRESRAPWPALADAPFRAAGLDARAFWSSYPLIPPLGRQCLLHVTSQTLATAALSGLRRPVVVTVHDLLPFSLRDDPRMTTLRHPVDRGFYRLAIAALRLADGVLADSVYSAEEAIRLAGLDRDRVTVVPLGVDSQRFKDGGQAAQVLVAHGLPPDTRYAIYVGSEAPRKNLPALWRAIAQVPDLRLLKVGPGHHPDERRRLENLAGELGIGDRITFIPRATDEELATLYAGATACVVPSLYEGFGLPVLEAMGCGAPVVCAHRTPLPEVAGDAALLVEPEPDALAEAIRRLMDEPALRGRLGALGRARAAQFSWRRTAQATVDAYGAVLERGTTRKHARS